VDSEGVTGDVQFRSRAADGRFSRQRRETVIRTENEDQPAPRAAGVASPLPPRFHTELVEALGSGDPKKADAAMRAHVRYGLVEITVQIGALAASVWRERRAAVMRKNEPQRHQLKRSFPKREPSNKRQVLVAQLPPEVLHIGQLRRSEPFPGTRSTVCGSSSGATPRSLPAIRHRGSTCCGFAF